jgi:hypothetical protein
MIRRPGVADTIRPSKIEISQSDWPISRRKVVVRIVHAGPAWRFRIPHHCGGEFGHADF